MKTIEMLKRRMWIPWWVLFAIFLWMLFLVRNAFADPMGGQNTKVLTVLGCMVVATLVGTVRQAMGRSTTVPALMLVGACGLYIVLSIVHMVSKGVVVVDIVGAVFAVVLITMIVAITASREKGRTS